MKIRVKVDAGGVIPQYQTKGSAGFDLHAGETITLPVGKVLAINTALSYEVPEGYEMQVRSRSGMALNNNIFVLNSPGCVDSDYRGLVKVILCNASNVDYPIKIGDRIAQGVIVKVEQAVFEQAESLSETERGEGGFGSTGTWVNENK